MIREAVGEEVERALKAQVEEVGFGLEVDKGRRGESVGDPWRSLVSQRVRCMACGYTRDVRHSVEEQVVLSVPPVVRSSFLPFSRTRANSARFRLIALSKTSWRPTPNSTSSASTPAVAAASWRPATSLSPNAIASAPLPLLPLSPLHLPPPTLQHQTLSTSLPPFLHRARRSAPRGRIDGRRCRN